MTNHVDDLLQDCGISSELAMDHSLPPGHRSSMEYFTKITC